MKKSAIPVLLTSLTALMGMLYGCSGKIDTNSKLNDNRVVLKLGNHVLLMADVERKFGAVEFENAEIEFERKKRFIEQYLERFLFLNAADEAGLSIQPDSAVAKDVLMDLLYTIMVLRKIEIDDDMLEEFFNKYGGEIQVGLLTLRDSIIADSLYEMLQNGADYDELVKQYSNLELGRSSGGSLGYVPYGQYDEDVQDPAYDLELNQYTKPVRFKYGWNIIKLYDHIKKTDEELQSNKEYYRNVAYKYFERKRIKEFQQTTLNKYNFNILDSNVEILTGIADSLKKEKDPNSEIHNSAFLSAEDLDDKTLNMVLAELDCGDITVDEFIDRVVKISQNRSPDLRDKYYMNLVFEDIAIRRVLYEYALQSKLDTLYEYRNNLLHTLQNPLIAEVEEKIYVDVPKFSDSELRKFYDENIDDFSNPKQIQVQAISVKTMEESERLLNLVKNGANFGSLAEKYSTDKKSAVNKGDIGFFTEKRFTEIYRLADNMEIGEIGGPVEMYGNYWMFKVLRKFEKTPKDFNQNKINIENRMIRNWKSDVYKSWIEEQKQKVEYEMNLDIIREDLGLTETAETGER